MKLLLAYPPHAYATHDVARGYERAFGRVPGLELHRWDFWPRIVYWDKTSKWWAAFQRRQAREAGHDVPRGAGALSRDGVLLKASLDCLQEALWYDVDWVIVVCGIAYHPDTVRMLRRSGRRVAAIMTENPYEDRQARRFGAECDVVFVNDRVSVNAFANAFYLPTGYDADVHRPDLGPADDHPDVLFVGTGFRERVRLLGAVDWTGIDLRLLGHWKRAYRNDTRIKPYVPPEAGLGILRNEDAARSYRAAAINLQLYRRDGVAESMSPRAYELAALGAFALHEDARAETREVFGDSVGYFDGPRDLEAKVRHYLARPGRRRRMALEAWERVQGHSYDDRARAVLDALHQASAPPAFRSVATGLTPHL